MTKNPLSFRASLALAETSLPVFPTSDRSQEHTMYDFYPEWGPARNNPESPLSHQAVQAALDLRDNGGERPDDN